MQTTDRKHLPALDGIRALAVFVVILYHSGVVLGVPGDLGVTAFFVLSGFLITWLLIKELDKTGTISLRDFYARRTLRIFPAYYAFVALSIVADYALHAPWHASRIAAAFTYTINYQDAITGVTNGPAAHAWSLAVEEQFYLLWPLAFLLLWKSGKVRTRQTVAIAIAVVLVWRSVLYLGFHSGSAYVYNAFDTRCDALAIGCWMALSGSASSYRRFEALVSRYAWMPIVSLVLLWISRTRLGAGYHYSLGMTVDALLLAVFLIQMLRLSESRLWSWLNQSWIRWLGRVSYPCYLWHGWGLAVGLHLAKLGPLWLQFVVGYLATLALASGSYYVIERPALSLKRRLRRTDPDPETSPPQTTRPTILLD